MLTFRALLLVGIGGGIGSILRYVSSWLITKNVSTNFPLATFSVNIFGCLLIGILIGIFGKQLSPNDDLKYLFITGFCGGYTTFSTFSAENIQLIQSGNYVIPALYITSSVLFGILAVFLGMVMLK
ncbi:MAG: fluoride efflux transporter CrcB [Flavobacteriales bacterium]|nr:fluoride efflux transporter CrcB [Crocinitomicaceae bacterium]NBX80059.1 fluoride efflux transporter CrcB [Flavobacteriales bacterium]NCA20164.1 fluoride efflux transporter CrcB [Crocinitomicaceae bacterium]